MIWGSRAWLDLNLCLSWNHTDELVKHLGLLFISILWKNIFEPSSGRFHKWFIVPNGTISINWDFPIEHPVHWGEHDCVPHHIQHIKMQQLRMEKEIERMNRVHQGQTGKGKERAQSHLVSMWRRRSCFIYWLGNKKGFTWIVSEPQGICLMTVDILSTLPRKSIHPYYIWYVISTYIHTSYIYNKYVIVV